MCILPYYRGLQAKNAMNMKNRLAVFVLAIVTIMALPSFALAANVKVSITNAIITTTRPVAPCQEIRSTPADQQIEIPEENADLPIVAFITAVPVGRNLPSGSLGRQSLRYEDRITYYSCPPEKFAEVQIAEATSGLEWYQRYPLQMISFMLSILDSIAKWLLKIFGQMIVTMIGQGRFITNDIVKESWPFVQGIANLGFIFALLYIALATTLRLEAVSSSIQRLLPKLLIGALLVNFSLVIGGLLIDTSRVLMAAEIKLMSKPSVTNTLTNSVDDFAAKLVQNSNFVQAQIASLKAVNKNGVSSVILRMIQNTLFIILLTAAMGVVAINLFARYIILLILLTLSPLAYLAIALPQTQGVVKQWWGMFLKWVFYGPIVLFFLIIITRVQESGISLPLPQAGQGFLNTDFFNQLVHFIVIVALFFIANKVSKQTSAIGSSAIMSFGKRAGSFARNNPKTALTLAGLAGGGIGTVAAGIGAAAGLGAGQAGVRRTRDFVKELGPKSIYDDKGNLKKGKSSIGTRWAQGLKSTVNPTEIAFRNQINQQQAAYNASPATYSSSAPGPAAVFSVKNLTNASFVSNIPPDLLKQLMQNGNSDQMNSLAAVIAKDKDGKIGKDQIKAIIDSATMGSLEHTTILTSIAQKPKHTTKLDDAQMAKMMAFHPDVTKSLLKSLSTEDKE